ncbi:TPA: 3-ketoacyl-CoA synthase 11 [Trebouxia sp. C0006]
MPQPVKGALPQSSLLKQYRLLFPIFCRFLLLILSYGTCKILISNFNFHKQEFWQESWVAQIQQGPLVAAAVLLACAALVYRRLSKQVYLLDFACYRPAEDLRVTWKRFMEGSRDCKFFTEESLDFQERISQRNGLGNNTFFPPSLHEEPPNCNMTTAREEAELVLFGVVQEVLDKTGLKARDIDILVVNCSLFNPTPSLSAMIVNHFKMRSNVISYNLAGMGCSAGVIAVGLAQRLLAGEPNSRALVVSTENITLNWYSGNERSMLIPNTLFRMGGAGVLLTNRPSDRWQAKYALQHIVRVHLGSDEAAYRCVYQHPDSKGKIGVELSRDLVKVAAKALTHNLTKLGPKVLPWPEKLLFAANWVGRKVSPGKWKEYVPDFREAFDHFCLHAGGRGVIEGLGSQLGLSQRQLEPSSSTLYWYGNTSSSSLWYALSYIESRQTVHKGDRVWQVGFGSGFKCNSAVWKALRTINSQHTAWKHLSKTGSTEQDSKLRVENTTADEGKTAAEKPSSDQTLLNGQNAVSHDFIEKENKSCNGHLKAEQELKVGLKDDAHMNGDAHMAEAKAGKNGQLKDEESGSGEIKAHSQPLNGKAGAVAVL